MIETARKFHTTAVINAVVAKKLEVLKKIWMVCAIRNIHPYFLMNIQQTVPPWEKKTYCPYLPRVSLVRCLGAIILAHTPVMLNRYLCYTNSNSAICDKAQ